jgi:hypothetical protein
MIAKCGCVAVARQASTEQNPANVAQLLGQTAPREFPNPLTRAAGLRSARPQLRRGLKALKLQVNECCAPDARLDYIDNTIVGKTGLLQIVVGDVTTTLPATWVWIGRIWAKSREMFKTLAQHFRTDPVTVALYDNKARPGKWLCVGNRMMRAGWEELP